MIKDPSEVLDYSRDWNRSRDGAPDGTGWLEAAETITASTWTVQTIAGDANPLVVTTPAASIAAGKTTVWLAGGTAGLTYKVTNHVTTSQGRQGERTSPIDIKER